MVDNQPGLDGLAQPHFIGQQNSGRLAASRFMSNIKLMRQQRGTRAQQTFGRRLLVTRLPLPSLITQLKA